MKKNNFNFFCKIYGRVQGVGFRSWTKKKADFFQLKGWVRNCQDNTVECEISGSKKQLNEFLKELKKGPILANVSDLKIKEIPPKIHQSFLIRH